MAEEKVLSKIFTTLGKLDGQMEGVGESVKEVRTDQRELIGAVRKHGERLGAVEAECKRRGLACAEVHHQHEQDISALRNCTGRIKIEQAKAGVKWAVVLKIVGLVAGSGLIGFLVKHLTQ
jgi:erythromycin esterase-like protein